MIKEPEIPEIAEYYVIAHPTRGYVRQSIYKRTDFTKDLKNIQLYSSLYQAQCALKNYKDFFNSVRIRSLTMCVN